MAPRNLLSLGAGLLLATTQVAAVPTQRVSGLIDTISNASLVQTALSQSYDYIIIGGGTAGAALAGRLSEDADKTVLVLEAGTRETTNPLVTVPFYAGGIIGTANDWNLTTAPQKYLNGTVLAMSRGRVLGGSSAMNMMLYTRGHKQDYNNWETLGNSGWDWNGLLPYHKKSETYTPQQGPNTPANGTVVYDPKVHGTSGPIQVSPSPFAPVQYNGIYNGAQELGLRIAPDLSGGDNTGISWNPTTLDPKLRVRSYSDSAYLAPHVGRTNLLVITRAQVAKILWSSKKSGSNVVASGVSFFAVGAPKVALTATSKGEVIVSAGSILTPQVLELSGIGQPKVLNAVGINTVVNLPGVGENLQDHIATLLSIQLKKGLISSETTDLTAAMAKYTTKHTGPIAGLNYACAFVPLKNVLDTLEYLKALALLAVPYTGLPILQQLSTISSLVFGSPLIEVNAINGLFGAVGEPNTSFMSVGVMLKHTVSRGNIHITSNSPVVPPNIDPRYFSNKADSYLLAKGVAWVRKLLRTQAFAPYLEQELSPGAQVADDDLETYLQTHSITEWHPIGTASMLPRSSNGVVSPELIVYGTTNVRIVDASIIPLQTSAHTQSTVYAIAEKAADLIRKK